MPLLTDMMGREVQVPDRPERVISLCPSQTLTLADLGASGQLAGITRFCIHPDEIWKSVKRIGGTKRVNFDAILEIQPDLIIGEKEENTEGMIQELSKDYPVYMTDVTDIPSSLDMVRRLGEIVGAEAKAVEMIEEIKQALGRIHPLQGLETAYLIWREPWMAAGRDTFIQAILAHCGFVNVFTSLPSRYPEISVEWMLSAQPQVLLLSDEPYPFAEKHIEEFQEVLPDASIHLVNGEYFSWYGSRMVDCDRYLNPLLDRIREQIR
jgi:ABC-type Fe3+-hydroxamate transport system substrate-binding protein